MTEPQQNATNNPLRPNQIAFLDHYFKQKGNISKACKKVGVDRTRYYDWMKNPQFQQAMQDVIESHNDLVIEKILKLALQSDKDLLKFWAKNQIKHRGFVEKQEVQHSGEIDNKLEVTFVNANENERNLNEDTPEQH